MPPMPRTIRLQSDSNAHDRPWRVAVEQGFFAAEGLNVEYHEDNPQGVAGRVENFSERWKETQLQQGALEVYPVCEWGAIERVQTSARARSSASTPPCAPAPSWCARIRAIQKPERPAQRADRGDLARRHVLCRDRGAGGGRRAVRRDQARPRQRPARRAAQRQDRSRRPDGAAGEPRRRGRLPQDRRPALARRHRRRRRRRRRDRGEAHARAQPRHRLAARERGALARGALARPQARAAQDRHDAGAGRRPGLPAGGVPGKSRLDDAPRLPHGGPAYKDVVRGK